MFPSLFLLVHDVTKYCTLSRSTSSQATNHIMIILVVLLGCPQSTATTGVLKWIYVMTNCNRSRSNHYPSMQIKLATFSWTFWGDCPIRSGIREERERGVEFLSELASKSFPPISNTKLCNKLSGFCWPPFTFQRERETYPKKRGWSLSLR